MSNSIYRFLNSTVTLVPFMLTCSPSALYSCNDWQNKWGLQLAITWHWALKLFYIWTYKLRPKNRFDYGYFLTSNSFTLKKNNASRERFSPPRECFAPWATPHQNGVTISYLCDFPHQISSSLQQVFFYLLKIVIGFELPCIKSVTFKPRTQNRPHCNREA